VRLRIIGNSHVRALSAARQQLGDELRTRFDDVEVLFVAPARFERVPFSHVEGARVRLRLRELTAGIEGPADLTSLGADDVWGVCMGLHNVTLVREPFWDTHEPARLASTEAAPVSAALMREIILATQRHVFDFLTNLKRAGIPGFVVASPPLHRDHPAVSLRRPEVMLEVDRLAREEMRRFADEHDIGFVDHPPETVADDGFLREEWYAPDRPNGRPDTSHGNAAYGALMLRRAVALAEDRFLEQPAGAPATDRLG